MPSVDNLLHIIYYAYIYIYYIHTYTYIYKLPPDSMVSINQTKKYLANRDNFTKKKH